MTLKSTSDSFSCAKEHVAGAAPLVDPQPHQMNDRALLMDEIERLASELSAACGYMRNASIDLSTGCPKSTAIRTIEGGLKRFESALNYSASLSNPPQTQTPR
jgi:hypothetical protein